MDIGYYLNETCLISIKKLSDDCTDDVNREAAGCTGSACLEQAGRSSDEMKVNAWECWQTKEF